MTNYIIVEEAVRTSTELLAGHLAPLPQSMDTVDLIGALFARYDEKGSAQSFRLRAFNAALDPHGLLVGYNDELAVFWRGSCGYFWVHRSKISFQHEAAFIPNSQAPIIDIQPGVKACYRFQRGVSCSVAIPIRPCSLAQQYMTIMQRNIELRKNAKKNRTEEETGSASSFDPDDGFALFEGRKP